MRASSRPGHSPEPRDVTVRESLRFIGPRAQVLLALGAGFGLAQSLVEPVLGVLLQVVLLRAGLADGARIPGSLRTLAASTPTLVTLFMLVAVVRTGAQFGAAQSGVAARTHIEGRLRNAAADKVLRDAFATLTPATDVYARIVDVFPRATALWQSAVQLASHALQAAAIAAVLTWLSPLYAALAINLLVVCAFAVRALGSRADHLSRALGQQHRAVLADFERAARHRALVKVLAMEDEERRTLARDVGLYEQTLRRAYALVHASGSLGPLVALAAVLAIVLPGPSGWARGPVALVTFLFLFVRLGQIGGNLGAAATGVRGGLRPWRQALEWIAVAPGAEPYVVVPVAAPPSASLPSSPPVVTVDTLHAGYGDEGDVLHGVSLQLYPGVLAGVRGPSGCGKTTLLHAVLGLLPARRGTIRIGGLSPADYARSGAVGYVAGDGGVFAGTIRANLSYGAPAGTGDELLFEAIRRAHATDVVNPSMGGLDRVVGEGGEGLSAGQRQRIALARALVRRPKLLVLDEPTANLDAATEAQIARALDGLRGTTTCIVVAHREALLAECDVVLTMNEGVLLNHPKEAA